MPRIALATCAEFPDLEEDDRPLRAALDGRGVEAVPAVWDDPAMDWSAFDLVVLRSTWDYTPRRVEFVAWVEALPAVLNPAAVVRWNTDKRYLRDLQDAGLPVVPTVWVEPGEAVPALPDGEVVVKPSVSAGSRDTARYTAADRDHALRHVAELQAAGRTVMVQPYLGAVDTAGETALLHLGGRYSHAIRKAPLLRAGAGPVEGLFAPEDISSREPSGAEREVAEAVLAAVPGGPADLLYARVDLVPRPDGAPTLLELELTEPSLFLGHAPGAAHRLAEAVLAWL